MKDNSKLLNFTKGLWKENPILVTMLGLCPTLAITYKVENALGMGLAVLFVLVMSNLIISLIRHIVPDEIRIPIFIVVIATFVSIVEMVMEAFVPDLFERMSLFISLIVVNCIILGRAEAFASKHNWLDSILDALGMALGFTLVLIVISLIREVLGTGSITIWGNLAINFNKNNSPFFSNFFVSPPAAFIILGLILAGSKAINAAKAAREVKSK
ncbi:MAG TPA: electron transport complex subunit E [Bacilli bacterium]|jgi:electron transport complex protein RnfE|nr:electron transport complex subunit E [Acholeplasmataceae bacterium]HOA79299.1 electron transport complex subunit E [Bacilli bacterium]HPZ27972.1 electron transport complex subunit E [Bacilli bacterium]HQC90308.1 electron transport complex subunit E [Bacilli bacterium]